MSAIVVENLGKSYRVNHEQVRVGYRTLRESLAGLALAPIRRLQNGANGATEEFWALKDVNFEVQPGEVIGIIGRNGAGKSTLLKILSRITKPTTGRVTLNGRVGSLLEVGTGFHPELTGRENIYMNGSILGMSRREITAKFDEIVAFAEIEKFLDTPVKRYSSGMYVRLAFAVAAHLEPEILIVDEVLAVGDVAFQKKCLGKMEDVARHGRTVLFVSHNLGAVQRLCKSCIVLDRGAIRCLSDSKTAVANYFALTEDQHSASLVSRSDRIGDGRARFANVRILNLQNQTVATAISGEPIIFELDYLCYAVLENAVAAIGLIHSTLGPVAQLNTSFLAYEFSGSPPGGRLRCTIPRLCLSPGRYQINLALVDSSHRHHFDQIEDAMVLDVIEGDFFKTGARASPSVGVLLIDHEWSS